jgi:hypothetical protein
MDYAQSDREVRALAEREGPEAPVDWLRERFAHSSWMG